MPVVQFSLILRQLELKLFEQNKFKLISQHSHQVQSSFSVTVTIVNLHISKNSPRFKNG
jgi:hypothetical protein